MKGGHRAAPGGKLDAVSVAIIRRYGPDVAIERGVAVTRRQMQRVAKGEAWADGWLPPQADDTDEFKICPVCRAKFYRRFANGRTRSDKLWAQKMACGNACNTKLFWARGVFRHRAPPTGRKRSKPEGRRTKALLS